MYMFVFSLYFAQTNFMIHSNARINLYFLRYIIPTSETHFWHHNREIMYRCGCNFGAQTFIWDHVFGTIYVPKERFAVPKELGPEEDFNDTFI